MSGNGIDIPVKAPGAQQAADDLTRVAGAAGKVGKEGQALQESWDRLTRSWSLSKAAINDVVGAAAGFVDMAAQAERTASAQAALGASLGQIRAAAKGAVSDIDLYNDRNKLLQAQLKFTGGEFAVLTRAARDHAVAIGTDAKGELDKLTDALAHGATDAIKLYGVHIKEGTKGGKLLGETLAQLEKEQKKNIGPAETMRERADALKVGFDNAKTAIVGMIAQLVHLPQVMKVVGESFAALPRDLGQVFGLDAAGKAADKLAPSTSSHGGADQFALGSVAAAQGSAARQDLRLQIAQQVAGIQKILGDKAEFRLNAEETSRIGDVDLLRLSSRLAKAQRAAEESGLAGVKDLGLDQFIKETQATETNNRAVQDATRAGALRSEGLPATVKEAVTAAAEASKTIKNRGGTGDGTAGKVVDPAEMEEAARAFQKFTDTIHDHREQLTGMMRQEGESTKEFLVRAAGAAENLWVDYEDRAIRHRGESEIEFAKRRIEIAEKAQQAIADNQRKLDEENAKIADEIEKAHDKKAADRLHREVAAITQIASVRKEMEGHGKASAADELGEKLARGETTLDTLEARLKAIGMEAAHSAAANDNGKLEALNAEAAAIGHVAGAERDRVRAQRESIDLSKQMGRAMLDFVGVNKTGEKSIADFATNALGKLTSGMQAHFGALIEGKETVGVALKGMLHDTLAALAQEAFPKAIMETAAGIAALASIALAPTAPGHFAAAGMYAAVAALGGLAASATATQAAPAASNAATAGANGGRTPNTGHAANDNAGGPTVININYSNMAFETSHQVGQQVHYILSDLGRRGVVSREYMVAGMRGMR